MKKTTMIIFIMGGIWIVGLIFQSMSLHSAEESGRVLGDALYPITLIALGWWITRDKKEDVPKDE